MKSFHHAMLLDSYINNMSLTLAEKGMHGYLLKKLKEQDQIDKS